MPERDTRTKQVSVKAPSMLGPHTHDLLQIIKDLQKRVARLESRINTH